MKPQNTQAPLLTATPGPWRIGDAGHTVFGPPNENPSPETVASNLTRANARLIAAAPDMLECLKQLHHYLANKVPLDIAYPMLEIVRATLTRAEGGRP